MEDMQDIFSSVDKTGEGRLFSTAVPVPGRSNARMYGDVWCAWGIWHAGHGFNRPAGVPALMRRRAPSRRLLTAGLLRRPPHGLQARACACRHPRWAPWRRCWSSCAPTTSRCVGGGGSDPNGIPAPIGRHSHLSLGSRAYTHLWKGILGPTSSADESTLSPALATFYNRRSPFPPSTLAPSTRRTSCGPTP